MREKVARALRHAKSRSERDWLVLSLIAEYGLKAGEVASLKPSQVKEGSLLLWGRSIRLRQAHARRLSSAEGAYIFEGRKGNAITVRQLQNIVKICSQATGADLTPNCLRRHFAKRFVERGGSVGELRKLLGHAHLQTTTRLLGPKD